MIGATLTSLSLVSLSISTLLFAPIFKFFGLTKTCGIGLALVAIGLAMIGVSTTAFTTGLGAFFYVCGVPLFTPSIPILLMQCVPTTSRGAVMGFDSDKLLCANHHACFARICIRSVQREGVPLCGDVCRCCFRYSRHQKFRGVQRDQGEIFSE